jgi:glycosyltransferase involved in cell wall biosynthesis
VARVALVCEPPDGGVAEHVRRLAAGLQEYGHEPVVFGPPSFAGTVGAFRELPLRRDYAHPHHDAAALGRLVRALRGFDLVHGHAAKAGVLARLAGAIARVPAIYTPHCLPFVGDVSKARYAFGLVVERALGPLTTVLIAVCEDERRIATRVAKRIEVVYNGTPPAPDVPPDPALLGDGPVVGAVTVLRRQKALETLIDAVPLLRERVPEVRVAIVGDGPEKAALQARAADRVAFLPFHAPAARHLKALDVFVLPSAWEAFPIAVLEAQACGVPQVATDVGGTREAVVPETGILVAPHDPRALAEALAELLTDPERRRRMGEASRARHAERFTAERMVRETAAVYDAAVTAGRRRAGRRAPRG